MKTIRDLSKHKYMEKHNFVTIADLSKEQILHLIQMAEEFERHPNRELLKGRIVATLFYEPSTRTRLSFETAANRLGAKVIGFSDAKASSVAKGETLKDTILMVSNYADVIAMRHYIEGAAQWRQSRLSMPVTALTCTPRNVCLTSTLSIKHREHSKTLIFILSVILNMAEPFIL